MPRRQPVVQPALAARAPSPRGASSATTVQLAPVALSAESLRGRIGLPLPGDLRRRMETLLDADLSAVRVHQGPQAEAIGARAFTVGDNVYFARQHYRPDSREGQALLAKHLAYVVQQRAGLVPHPGGRGVVLVRHPALEAQAEQLAALASQPASIQAKRLPSDQGMFQIKTRREGIGKQHLELYERGRAVGGADVVLEGGQARLYNLRIDEAHRGRGGGDELLRAAAEASARVGKRKLGLDAQDDGSGRLLEWYESQGFVRNGAGRDGLPALEADVGRLKRR